MYDCGGTAGDARLLLQALDALDHPFYVIDVTNYRIVLANRATAKFGLGEATTCYQLTHHRETPCDGTSHACPLSMVARTMRPACMEHVHYNSDGAPVDVEVHGYPLLDGDGKLRYMVEYTLDVTERNRVLNELRSARQAAEAASAAKSMFLANMSHEIRTPLNGVIGMAELMASAELSPDQADHLAVLRSSADSLLVLLNDILDFSRIEAGKLALESLPFSVEECLASALMALVPRAHEKNLEIVASVEAAVPDIVVGDAARLRQVLLNLVGNAVKFTHAGEVLVRVEVVDACGDEIVLRFAVTDTGIGMTDEQLRHVFSAFTQADATMTRRYGGTGLGLAISSQLTALMGGELTASSDPGAGSTFSFSSAFGTARRDGSPSGSGKRNLAGVRVLIADGNATARRSLGDLLATCGMDVVQVAGGREAVAELTGAADAGIPFAIAVLAGRMTDFDGYDVARALDGGTAPAILITAPMIGLSPRDRLAEPGIDGYLFKPFRNSEVLSALDGALSSRAAGCGPAVMAAGPRRPVPVPVAHGGDRLRILLVEDFPVNQKVAVRLLDRLGHEVTVANDGRQAISLWEQGGYDVILMDVQMPILDGLAATQAIRAAEAARGGHVLIIALTAHAFAEDKARCLSAGMDDVLTKPIRMADLAARLATVQVGWAAVR